MRVALHPCFILHQRSYRETSLLLDVFSRLNGRISLVAKGARRNKRNIPALFRPLRPLNISWSGRGALATLNGIEANGMIFDLQGELLISAFYLNELLIRLLHKHEAHVELFDAYLQALTRLAQGESQSKALRYFEKQLLAALGYGLILDYEVESGQAINPAEEYYYVIDRGPFSRKPGNVPLVKISGSTLLALDRERIDQQCMLHEAKQLMRMTLNTYLGDKPLASRKLYQAYRQQLQ